MSQEPLAAHSFPYDAVLLAGFGGPEHPDDVMPFLRNVTAGRGIPEERLIEVSHHYQALGGVSPINEQNRQLQVALQAELIERGLRIPVLWGNRNWHPLLADTVTAAKADGHRRLLGITTSAYSSYSSCRQYREDFGQALIATDSLGELTIDKVRPYFDQPGFVEPFIDGTVHAVRQALDDGISWDEIHIVFTTHSIPTTMADTAGSAALGDHGTDGAYVAQHQAVCRAVMAAVEQATVSGLAWQLAYQSRSGPPAMPWLEPDIGDVLADLSAGGTTAVVVVPIGFVSDHVEVIWDLDHEAAQIAEDLGLRMWRVPTPGTDPRFVAGLVDLIAERLGRGLPHESAVDLPERPDVCPAACCVNTRGAKPTTAGQDSAADWQPLNPSIDKLAASGIGCQTSTMSTGAASTEYSEPAGVGP